MHKVKFGSSRFDDWVESWVQDFRYTVSSLACQPYHCKIWKQGGLKGPLMERIGLHTRNVGLPISEKENWRQTTTVTQASEDRKEQATKQKQNEPSIQGSRWKRKLKRTEWTPMNANLRPMVSNELPQLRLTGQAWLPPPHNMVWKCRCFLAWGKIGRMKGYFHLHILSPALPHLALLFNHSIKNKNFSATTSY